jgi:putative tryptophan/tyrosine transport system substrate-binding protein
VNQPPSTLTMLLSRHTRRREFIALLGGGAPTAAGLWPLATRAQQPAMPVIGFLNAGARDVVFPRIDDFRKGLGENGYTEGRNVSLEYRWADGEYDRLPSMAADLVGRDVAVIAAFGPPAAFAAKRATSKIPIVFVSGSDPVQAGLVTSLNRPGGNVTGVHIFVQSGQLQDKRLGLLRSLVPKAKLIGILINPRSPDSQTQLNALQVAARAIGQQLRVVEAATDKELDVAFATLEQDRADALVDTADVFFNTRVELIVALAARYAIPMIHPLREFVVAVWHERARRLLPERSLRRSHPERCQS